MSALIFLKLGGSLITDKTKPYTVRANKLAELAVEINRAYAESSFQLVLGHGSGSFGHTAAKKHGTRQGVGSREEWLGFAEVWRQAATLNHFVMDALHTAGLPALTFSPLSSVSAADGKISAWDLTPLTAALNAGLIPVIYGDVVFDAVRGGTILSTEDLFEHLARSLRPQRILLAGLEEAVWADYPLRKTKVEKITPQTFPTLIPNLGGSHGADVTGGMFSKVEQMLRLTQAVPGLSAQIFSGETPHSVFQALQGEHPGTLISAEE